MSVDRWNSVLVLGGIRSGKSAFAESLVADAPSVRYIATSATVGEDDAEWRQRIEEHQRRRPGSWTTEETGSDPTRLASVLAEAKPDDTLLVDDLGGWVTALLDPALQPNDDVATLEALADAVRMCTARLVLVSPEVGLAPVPSTPLGRAFADALGSVNQAVAAAVDRVALVVAGRALWIAGTPIPVSPARPVPAAPPPGYTASEATIVGAPAAAAAAAAAALVTPAVSGAGVAVPGIDDLPVPDPDAGPDARDRLTTIDLAGRGIGTLTGAVEFAAATQGTTLPRPWDAVRLLLIAGAHAGGAAAGTDPAETERLVAQVETGEGALSRLAGEAGADVAVLRVSESGAMEDGPVLTAEAVDAALRHGRRIADQAAEDGRDALILGSLGAGTEAAATAVLAAITAAEPVAILPRVLAPGGRYDDAAWMTRCAAVRDALHRARYEPREARDVLAQLGGADLAVATGAVLGAAAHKIPVLLDGPLGVAAGLLARDIAPQARLWCMIPDAGIHALVKQGADVLGVPPVTELKLDLGEGANALAVLPMLRAAIGLAGALPVHPELMAAQVVPDPALAVSDAAVSEAALSEAGGSEARGSEAALPEAGASKAGGPDAAAS